MGSFGIGKKSQGLRQMHQGNGKEKIITGHGVTVTYTLGVGEICWVRFPLPRPNTTFIISDKWCQL